MAAPAVAIAVGAVRRSRRARGLLIALFILGGVWLVVLVGAIGALFGLHPLQGAFGPSRVAAAEIPQAYLELYQQAGQRYGIDPWVLAAIGHIETNHGRLDAPGVRSGVKYLRLLRRPDAVLDGRRAEHLGRLRRRRQQRRPQVPI